MKRGAAACVLAVRVAQWAPELCVFYGHVHTSGIRCSIGWTSTHGYKYRLTFDSRATIRGCCDTPQCRGSWALTGTAGTRGRTKCKLACIGRMRFQPAPAGGAVGWRWWAWHRVPTHRTVPACCVAKCGRNSITSGRWDSSTHWLHCLLGMISV